SDRRDAFARPEAAARNRDVPRDGTRRAAARRTARRHRRRRDRPDARPPGVARARSCDPARRARHGRRLPHRRSDHRHGERHGHRDRRAGCDSCERGRPGGVSRRSLESGGNGGRRNLTVSTVARTRYPATAISALIEARDLHAHYGESHALRGVSLSINSGESLGLLGRNGMGKTTLIRTLIGLMRASAGSVLVHGRDCTAEPAHRIARMGVAYVPEGRGIFPNLSVRENLLFAARPPDDGRTGWTYERVLDTFAQLRARVGAGGHQLSGGEQQMLAIGRALMTN